MNDLLTLQPVAKELAQSRLHAHRNPADVLFVLSAGQALGLNAATALMNIYNVNGMPSLKADLKLALAKNHPEYNGCEIDATAERCIVKMSRKRRDGQVESVEITFTMQDAIRAELAKKDNWRKYPQRMLKARAISYAVNDLFPDIVFGMMSHEEAIDLAADADHVETAEYTVENITPVATQETITEPDPKALVDAERQKLTGIMAHLVENKIDGMDNDIRRHESIKKHLKCDMIRDCQNIDLMKDYAEHLEAKKMGVKKPTVQERKDALIDRITNAPMMLEELQEWSEKVQSAKRHNALNEVDQWLDEHFPVEAK